MRALPEGRHPERSEGSLYFAVVASTLCLAMTFGCKSSTNTSIQPRPGAMIDSPIYARPTVPPPPFKLFHQTQNSLTLVTDSNATDDQIAALVFQLRDAAHAHTFDALHLPQKLVDARDPILWVHIYRGAKCASEKYTTAALPCGPSYHAAADYTLGGFTKRDRDEGVLLHDESHQTQLWNPDAPYTSAP